MRTVLVATILVSLSAPAAHAVEATFLGTGTYATPGDCSKVAKLATGAPRRLNSVPETLTARGYMSWEGGCTIEKVVPKVAGKSWTVSLSCSEGAIENAKSKETWVRNTDGSWLISGQYRKARLVACAIPKKK
jgi:hypothetical protein